MMTKKNLLGDKNEVNRDNIAEALQQAIEIEIATIPTYLYTYYSIMRVPHQPALNNNIYRELVDAKMSPDDATQKAQELSALLMVFANKAGALILSVVIEEMLHMSLSSNVKQAIAGMPELIGKSPFVWPTELAGHDPSFPINKAKLSLEQLMTFLCIESPKPLLESHPVTEALEDPMTYTTIGKFYKQIQMCIERDFKNPADYHTDKPQLVPDRGYYAQNCIDTVYYNSKHQPKFVNAEDSGDLIHVTDKDSALKAIQEIVDQGEGYQGRGLNKDGSVNCDLLDTRGYDDRAHKELSHFVKFNELYCQLKDLDATFKRLTKNEKFDVGQYFIHNLAKNPVTSDYPAKIQKISNLINAVYSYIFVMTEACYRADHNTQADQNTQYEIFMFGIHKSMMWVLDSLCGSITAFTYTGADNHTYSVAPTFEEYPFSRSSSPKSQIISLYQDMRRVYSKKFSGLEERLNDLPDVSAEGWPIPIEQPSNNH